MNAPIRTELDTAAAPLFAPEVDPSRTSGAAFELTGVTVKYRSYNERPTSLKESVIRLVRDRSWRHYSLFDALLGVNLRIPRGSVFGIIGSNGSGKSTLLKVLSGVLPPTKGTVIRNGTISSLIELGAGFDPELNAIENIYLHGSLHRKSRAEIKDRVDHIISFAELSDFAYTPIKYYSSGMYARLGFSAAVDIDPDILLVDEILGVGDERFQEKCQAVFKRFMASGKTIVIVSHDMGLVGGLCATTAVLSRGEVAFCGDTAEAIKIYRDPTYRTRLESGQA
jgi:ABC-2 type transport system ATP-binding protein